MSRFVFISLVVLGSMKIVDSSDTVFKYFNRMFGENHIQNVFDSKQSFELSLAGEQTNLQTSAANGKTRLTCFNYTKGQTAGKDTLNINITRTLLQTIQ